MIGNSNISEHDRICRGALTITIPETVDSIECVNVLRIHEKEYRNLFFKRIIVSGEKTKEANFLGINQPEGVASITTDFKGTFILRRGIAALDADFHVGGYGTIDFGVVHSCNTISLRGSSSSDTLSIKMQQSYGTSIFKVELFGCSNLKVESFKGIEVTNDQVCVIIEDSSFLELTQNIQCLTIEHLSGKNSTILGLVYDGVKSGSGPGKLLVTGDHGITSDSAGDTITVAI